MGKNLKQYVHKQILKIWLLWQKCGGSSWCGHSNLENSSIMHVRWEDQVLACKKLGNRSETICDKLERITTSRKCSIYWHREKKMKFLCYDCDYGERETMTLYKIRLKFYTIYIGPESSDEKINTSIVLIGSNET